MTMSIGSTTYRILQQKQWNLFVLHLAPHSVTLSSLAIWLGLTGGLYPSNSFCCTHTGYEDVQQICASLSLSWQLYWFYSNPQVSLHSLFVLLRVNSSPGVEGAMCSPSLPSPGHESQFPGFPAVCSFSPLPGLGFSSASLWSDFLSWTALKKTLVEKKNFWSMFFWLIMLIFLQCTELFFCVLS